MRPGHNNPRWAQQGRTSNSNLDIFEAEAVIIEQRLESPGAHATRLAPAPIRETRGGFGFGVAVANPGTCRVVHKGRWHRRIQFLWTS